MFVAGLLLGARLVAADRVADLGVRVVVALPEPGLLARVAGGRAGGPVAPGCPGL